MFYFFISINFPGYSYLLLLVLTRVVLELFERHCENKMKVKVP